MSNNLNSLLGLLLENQIDFVLIGGFAAVFHGASQVTKDIDVCMLTSPDQIRKLRGCLSELHPKHRMNPSFKPSFLTHPTDLGGVQNIYLETDLGVLDVVSSVVGVGSFDEVKKRSIEISLFAHKCKIISIEDLIRAKEKMGREKDRVAVTELRIILDKIRAK